MLYTLCDYDCAGSNLRIAYTKAPPPPALLPDDATSMRMSGRSAPPTAAETGAGQRLVEAITSIGQCITGCRMNRRTQEPNTYQLLLDASLLGIGMPEGRA
jgi:hypothetical protein